MSTLTSAMEAAVSFRAPQPTVGTGTAIPITSGGPGHLTPAGDRGRRRPGGEMMSERSKRARTGWEGRGRSTGDGGGRHGEGGRSDSTSTARDGGESEEGSERASPGMVGGARGGLVDKEKDASSTSTGSGSGSRSGSGYGEESERQRRSSHGSGSESSKSVGDAGGGGDGQSGSMEHAETERLRGQEHARGAGEHARGRSEDGRETGALLPELQAGRGEEKEAPGRGRQAAVDVRERWERAAELEPVSLRRWDERGSKVVQAARKMISWRSRDSEEIQLARVEVVRRGGVLVRYGDIMSLGRHKWVRDPVVNAYMALIQRRSDLWNPPKQSGDSPSATTMSHPEPMLPWDEEAAPVPQDLCKVRTRWEGEPG